MSQLQEEINNPKQYNVRPFVDEKGNKKSIEEVRKKLKEKRQVRIFTLNLMQKFFRQLKYHLKH